MRPFFRSKFLLNPKLGWRTCRRPPGVLAFGDLSASRPGEAGHEPSRFAIREAGRRRLRRQRLRLRLQGTFEAQAQRAPVGLHRRLLV
jgi:hypothetical protein